MPNYRTVVSGIRITRSLNPRFESGGRILLGPLLKTPQMYSRLHYKYPGLRSQRAVLRALDTKSARDVKPVRHSKFYRCSDPGDGGR